MPRRKTIVVPGFSHANPIPAASQIGNVLVSSVISGRDPVTEKMPDSLEEQIANIFAHVRSAVQAAGGTPEDIIKMNFWVEDPAIGREALNSEWLKMFPDADSRPGRHTLTLADTRRARVTCDFMAVLG